MTGILWVEYQGPLRRVVLQEMQGYYQVRIEKRYNKHNWIFHVDDRANCYTISEVHRVIKEKRPIDLKIDRLPTELELFESVMRGGLSEKELEYVDLE